MKRLLTIALLWCFGASAQTNALSFAALATDYTRPGSGAMNWNDGWSIVAPPGYAGTGINRYCRFTWSQMQNDNGTFNWTAFDARVQIAIQNGQTFTFGIMPTCEGCGGSTVAGATLNYPLFLHTQMQAEAVKDYNGGDLWTPNWNSPSFMTAWWALLAAIASHLNTTTINGVLEKNAIDGVDIRGYGNFGEWHNFPYTQPGFTPAYPAAIVPTSAVLDSIIASHIRNFPNYPLYILIGAFDHGDNINIPLDVTYFALTQRNTWGPIGWRRDNLGDEVNYAAILENNPNTFNSLVFKTAIMTRYLTAPIGGEPLNGGPSGGSPSTIYGGLLPEVNRYGIREFGNGNMTSTTTAPVIANFQAAVARSGAKLRALTGTIPQTIVPGSPWQLKLNWENINVAPEYNPWNTTIELRNGTTVTQSWISGFQPQFFAPTTTAVTTTDNFLLNSTVPAGTYNVYLILRDPVGYRKPMPLGQTLQLADGAYLLRSITVSSSAPLPPIANAGPDQTIQLPVNNVTLDGSLSSFTLPATGINYSWVKSAGPATFTLAGATTVHPTVTGMIQGTYTFSLTVTDNNGRVSTVDNVNITVSAANLPPTANAGVPQTITLPTSSTTLNGTGSAAHLPATTLGYAWSKLSGGTATIVSPAASSTSVTGLTQGTYVFQLIVTDNLGQKDTATVQVSVNAAPTPPTVSAGSAQVLLLPGGATTTVTGTAASVPPAGSISTLLWQKVSGPAGAIIASTTTLSTSISGLVQGVYVFSLTATDNNGNTSSATVQITVNAPPTVSAGANKMITAASTPITGSASAQPGGSITTYLWVQVSGPNSSVITPTNTTAMVASNLVVGVYVYRLTATDNLGHTASATMQLTVNQNPIANAGPDQNVTLPVTVTLTAAASSGPINSYLWSMVSGPNNPIINTATAAITTLAGLTAGTYTFQVSVNSGVSRDTMTLVVNAHQVPIANAGSPQTITLPITTVNLFGTAQTFQGANVTIWKWLKVSGPGTTTIASPAAQNTSASGLQQGTYVFSLQVTDNAGGVSTLSTVTITVNAALPVANAGTAQSTSMPTNTLTLDGSASVNALTYTWTTTSGPSVPVIASVAKPVVTSLLIGTYKFLLTVGNGQGSVSTSSVSDTVKPQAQPPANPCGCIITSNTILRGGNRAPAWGLHLSIDTCKPVTVLVGASQIISTLSLPVKGTVSSNNGTSIEAIRWRATGVVFADSTSITTTAVFAKAGTYTLQLLAWDSCGAMGSSTLMVTVLTPPVKYATNITWTPGATTLYYNWSDGTYGTVALPQKVAYVASYPSSPGAALMVGFVDGTKHLYQ